MSSLVRWPVPQPTRRVGPTTRIIRPAIPACFTRDFDGSDDRIRTSPGSVTDSGAYPRTFVAIIKRGRSGHSLSEAIIGLNASDDVHSGLHINPTDDRLGLLRNGVSGASVSTFTIVPADGWVLVAGGKATGTATPRFHKYVYNTATWTHQDGSAAIADADPGATLTCQLGSWFDGFDFFDGQIAVAGVFPANLSDANVETLELGLQAWMDLQTGSYPVWRLDQDSTATAVPDIVGGADQTAITGTAVVQDCPAGFNWTLGAGQAISLADSGGASDVLAVTTAVPLADTASSTETVTVAAAVPFADSASASETLDVSQPITLTDSASAADQISITAAVPLAEAGSAADIIAVSASVPLAESGSAADAISVDQSEQKPVSDVGAAADAVTVAAAVPLAESGAAADALAIAQTRSLTDIGAAADSLAVSQTRALADSGTAADTLTIAAAIPFADAAAAAETITAAILLSLTETASGTDALVVTIPPPVPPPRWVEHDSDLGGVVEGGTSGGGVIELVGAGTGVVEGSSSL